MTAWGSVELAVEAMRRGASDFVQKPWDNTQLLDVIDRFGTEARQESSDIDIARNVQHKLFGRATKQVTGLDYAGQCLPVGHVGGDYFDFLDLGPETLGVALADVSGKGMGAALLMAHLQAALRSHRDLALEPELLVERINQLFWESSSSEQYATLFFCTYDGRSRTLRYINAGHSAPILLKHNRAVESLDSTGLPVGMFPSWRGTTRELMFRTGDTLAVVSDGVLEAGNKSDSDFGDAGVTNCLRRFHRYPAAELIQRLLTEAGSCGAADDMTAVVLRVV
jgi:sigma-B regulation protein RsbU (phosphoserine phosphatase)